MSSSNSSDGFLLFLREGSLLAQAFDGRSQLRGDAIPIAEGVGNTGSYGWFSASATGILAFRTGSITSATAELLWFNRQGQRVGQFGPRLEYGVHGVQLSPDGKRVVVTKDAALSSGAVGSIQGSRAWIADLSRAIFSPLNSGEGTEGHRLSRRTVTSHSARRVNGAVGDL